MNVQKLNHAIAILREDLGDGLLSSDIFTVKEGMSVAGYNTNPKASALFNMLTTNIMKTLRGAGFPNLDKYYLMNVEGDKMIIVIPLGNFRWGMLVDTTKVQLGLLVSIAIPRSIEAFEEALK